MPISTDNLILIALLLFVATVAGFDLTTRRIPNMLTIPSAVLALILNTAAAGTAGLLAAGGGLLIGLGIFVPFFLVRGFGAGDVKAMAAIGAFVGPKAAALSAGFTLAIGSVFGLVLLLLSGGLGATLYRWWGSAALVRAGGQFGLLKPQPGDAAARRFPYGLAIASGTLVALWWLGRLQLLYAG